MSVRAMTLVWESALSPPSLKLTALALADWSNDEGGSLHPSMSAIAKKPRSGFERRRPTFRDLQRPWWGAW